MYLELICKYGDMYACVDSRKGYVYYNRDAMVKEINKTPVTERNCFLRNGVVALKHGLLPILGVGVNFISHFDGRMQNAEYVYDIDMWFNAHANIMHYDEFVKNLIFKHTGYETIISGGTPYLRKAEGVGYNNELLHVHILPTELKAIIIANTVISNDRICVLNITNCPKTPEFIDIISRVKVLMLFDANFERVRKQFNCDVFMYGKKVE